MISNDVQRHSVLIVEDEAVSRRALSALLSMSGYDAHAVSSAEAALELVEGGQVPEVALIDLDLPGMNGMELISRLRRDHPGVVSVLITATSRERVERMNGREQVEYMQKPVDLKCLLTMLDRGGRMS